MSQIVENGQIKTETITGEGRARETGIKRLQSTTILGIEKAKLMLLILMQFFWTKRDTGLKSPPKKDTGRMTEEVRSEISF